MEIRVIMQLERKGDIDIVERTMNIAAIPQVGDTIIGTFGHGYNVTFSNKVHYLSDGRVVGLVIGIRNE